jgi:hypothetical protein
MLKDKLLHDPTIEPRFRIRVSTLVSALFISVGLIVLIIFLIVELAHYFA